MCAEGYVFWIQAKGQHCDHVYFSLTGKFMQVFVFSWARNSPVLAYIVNLYLEIAFYPQSMHRLYDSI